MNAQEIVDHFGRDSSFTFERMTAPGLNHAYEMTPPRESAQGHASGYFDDGHHCLTVRQLKARRSFFDDEPGLGRVVFLFHLSGWRRIEIDGSCSYTLREPTLVVFCQPIGSEKRSFWRQGRDEVALSVGMWPDMLETAVGSYAKSLPNFAGHQQAGSEPFWFSKPLPYSMMSAARQLLNPIVHTALVDQYISVKAQELSCLGISALLGDNSPTPRFEALESKIDYLTTLIDANLQNPPSLKHLAASIGVTPQELSNDIYSGTRLRLGQYIADRRMKQALRLFETTEKPLKQVAHEVGYNHTSNFCIAFKRHFGRTPKDVRSTQAGDQAVRGSAVGNVSAP